MTAALVALAGGVGAAFRFLLDGVIADHADAPFPVGTLVVNVLGSFLLGGLAGAAPHAGLHPDVVAVLGTGLLGGFTTFSTASVELVRLARSGRSGAAAALGLSMLLISLGAASLGLWVGAML